MSNYDDALVRFSPVDLEYGEGLANHGPMGAEALVSLGHHALIPALTDLYVPRLQYLEPGRALLETEEEESLGDFSRRSDWVATFEARLAQGDWRTAVAGIVPGLLPGLFAAAGHGLLRTAHAVRGLEREDTPLGRAELARGLAHWAARYQTLPGLPGSRASSAGGTLAERFAAWPLHGESSDAEAAQGEGGALARGGLIRDGVAILEASKAYLAAVESVALPAADSVAEFLEDLIATSADLYLRNSGQRVAYVHAVTIPSAVEALTGLLTPEQGRLAAGYALQAVGAIHSVYGATASTAAPDDEVERMKGDWAEIRYHAACSIQEHSIKMVDACWRADLRRPNPLLGHAAADAALKIEGRGQTSIC